MSHIGIALYLVFTFLISFMNAFWAGSVWLEMKLMGWAGRVLVYSVAIMSLCGFLWFNLICETFLVEAVRAHNLHGKYLNWVYSLPPHYPDYVYSLGYLIIILPIIGAGLVMTVWSWVAFNRLRSWRNGAGAFYNSGATLYNIWGAVRVIPQALSNIGGIFSGSSSGSGSRNNKNGWVWIVVGLVALALVLAVAETILIIKWSARWHAGRMKGKIADRAQRRSDSANVAGRSRW